jgi:hypothetical protein
MARQNVFAYRLHSAATIDATTDSAQSIAAPFGCSVVRLSAHHGNGIKVFITQGSNPTASTTAGMIVEHGTEVYLTVAPTTSIGGSDGDKIAVVTATGTATVNVAWME